MTWTAPSNFYADLFGWEISRWDGPPQMDYRLGELRGTDGPGINGGDYADDHL